MRIVIPGNAIAKKNSQRIIKLGRRSSIRPSAQYDAWEQNAIFELKQQLIRKDIAPYAGSYPVAMLIFFFRRDRKKFDLSNMLEGTQDVLQKVEIIDDDSMNHLVPVIEFRDGCFGWTVDKKNPRTEIRLIPLNTQGAGDPRSSLPAATVG